MGEWQAWHPTVSRQSRSTDITDGFGPGTRWSAGPESYIDEVVAASPGLLLAASLVFRVPSGPPARSPSAPRACGSARRLEARPGPAVPPAPSTLPCGPDGTLHTGGAGASRAARPERGGSTASAQNYRAHDGVCEKCDGLNVSEPTEHSTIARGVHAVE